MNAALDGEDNADVTVPVDVVAEENVQINMNENVNGNDNEQAMINDDVDEDEAQYQVIIPVRDENVDESNIKDDDDYVTADEGDESHVTMEGDESHVTKEGDVNENLHMNIDNNPNLRLPDNPIIQNPNPSATPIINPELSPQRQSPPRNQIPRLNLETLLRNQIPRLNLEALPPLSLRQWCSLITLGVFYFCSTPIWNMPYAIKEGGWLGLLVFIFFCCLNFLTSLLIPSCINILYCINNPNIPITYLQLGNLTFEVRGRVIFTIISCIFSYATCIDVVVLIRDNLNQVFPSLAPFITTLVVLFLSVMLVLLDVDEYHPFLPGVSIALTIMVIAFTFWLGVSEIGFQGKGKVLFSWSTIHYAWGFYGYCFAGQSYLPMIYVRAQNTRQYRRILLITFFVSAVIYAASGCIGYAMYGTDVQPVFTLNLPMPSALSYVVIVFMFVIQVIRFVINISPLATFLEGLLPEERRTDNAMLMIGCVVGGSTIAIAVFGSSSYATLISLSGSIVCVTMSLIIPSVLFLRIRTNDMTVLQGVFCRVTIAIGILSALFTFIRTMATL